MSFDVTDPEVAKAVNREIIRARHHLWRQGNLEYLWDPTQKKIDKILKSAKGRQFYLNCSRRLGKTFYLVTRGFEICLKTPHARVLFTAPQAKDAKNIVSDILVKILPDCPDDLRPVYKSQDNEFHFPNGAILRLKGVNGDSAKDLRGTEAHIILADEVGFYDNFGEVLKSVFLPMILSTRGQIIMASTPATHTGHDSYAVYTKLALKGATADFNIRDADSTRYPDELKAEFLVEAGEAEDEALAIVLGILQPRTTTAQREYFVKWVSDADSRVIPEWTDEAAREIVQPTEYDGYSDAYTVIDPGFNDGAGMLFLFNDFRAGRLAVVGESLLYKASTVDLAEEVLEQEFKLFKAQKPTARYSDVDPRLRADFYKLHGISIGPVQKQGSLEAVNLVRAMVRNRELYIDPSCTMLLKQLEFGVWNKKATDFARDEDGHLDLLACLKYACRMINRKKMPAGHVPTARERQVDTHRSQREQKKPQGLLPNTPWGRRLAALTKKKR